METRKIISTDLMFHFLVRAAFFGCLYSLSNDITSNDISSNGIVSNGIVSNGIVSNGIVSNGITSNRMVTNNISLKGLVSKTNL